MAEKRNEIMEEQRKAREEFLRLKKMQQGEIEPEAKPSDVAIKPRTFGEKAQNFWYHFKVQIILAVMFAVIIAIVTTQCATRERFDFSVLYFTYTPTIDAQLDGVEEYFEKYATDLDGNGEVNIQVANCSVSDSNRDAGRNTMFAKVQSVLVAEHSTVLYLIDDKAKQYFEDAFDYSLFVEEPFKLGEDFYKQVTDEKMPLPDDLMLGLRIIKNTGFEGNKEAEKAFLESQKVLEKIKQQNS